MLPAPTTAILLLLLATTSIQSQRACLHNGCEMSAGLKIADINTTIARNLKRTDIKANLVTALSWDLGRALPTEENNREMCRILKNIKATFVGLQDVDEIQRNYLTSCLPELTIVGEDSDSPRQNILIFRNSQHTRLRKRGSFKASDASSTGYQSESSCTWMRLQFVRRSSVSTLPQFSFSARPRKTVVTRLHRILSLLLPQKSKNVRTRRDAWSPYRRSSLYVAVMKIHGKSEQAAATELHYMVSHLRNKIMDRRRFSLLLLVDLGKEDNSLAYRSLERRYYWIKNTMQYSVRTFPAMTRTNPDDPLDAMLDNYIMKHRFHGLVSGIISDNSIMGVSPDMPVFAALM